MREGLWPDDADRPREELDRDGSRGRAGFRPSLLWPSRSTTRAGRCPISRKPAEPSGLWSHARRAV